MARRGSKKGKSGCLPFVMIIVAIVIACLFALAEDESGIKNIETETIYTTDVQETDEDYENTTAETTEKITEETTLFTFSFWKNEEDDWNIERAEVRETPCSYYSQLNSIEKDVYQQVLAFAQRGETEGTVIIDYNGYSNAFNRSIEALVSDNPDLFWLRGGWLYSNVRRIGSKAKVDVELTSYDYWLYKLSMQRYINEFNSKVEQIAERADTYASDYEKAKYVHDYLVQNAFYATEKLEEAQKTFHDSECELIYSAYGCVVQGESVCAGYAKAFQVIMQEMDIDCSYVTGYANNGRHAWNCVELDGKYYLVDVTWDDPVGNSGEYICYDYFCITDSQMSIDHTADESEFSYPDCVLNDYNWYAYNNYLLNSYSLESVEGVYNSQKNNNAPIVKFSNASAYNRAKTDLFENRRWSEIDSLPQQIKYIADDEHYTIRILK